ncbi:HNH endonuclease family protein [Streptomyces sp. NPDC050509]|uniref:HNH endonuclease family protein n=1 Tax=Streptomyces sp. NPDC050509 TaxID=3365620 RepID=UPI0037910B85
MSRVGEHIARTCRRGGALALSALVLAGCAEPSGPDAKPSQSATGSTTGGGGGGADAGTFGVSPLDNGDGTKPGLAPLASDADKKAGLKIVEQVTTKGRGPRTGYDRKKFGYAWMDTADGVPLARNGCDTRNDLLARDGKDLTYRSGSDCVVISMNLNDPYTGKEIDWRKEAAAKVQIDHVIPLSYSWQMGASRWDEAKRKQLANDPLNLVPVDGPTNGSKSDSGPASWLPPSKGIRCSYAVRFAQVALKYELPVTTADKKTMLAQCGG